MLGNPIFHDRRNIGAPFAAVENAIMANAFGHIIFLARLWQIGRNIQRGLGLTQP